MDGGTAFAASPASARASDRPPLSSAPCGPNPVKRRIPTSLWFGLPLIELVPAHAQLASNRRRGTASALSRLHGFVLKLGSKLFAWTHRTPLRDMLSPFKGVWQIRATSYREDSHVTQPGG
jgi:hypothetical protein